MMVFRDNAPAPAVLTIDLAALAANYRQFRSMTSADVAGVIKADAYGTGALQVFETLKREGCRNFYVATPEEAAALDGEGVQLFVLGGFYEGAEDFYLGKNLIPVLNSEDDTRRWSVAAEKTGKKLPAALHIDTGMNRLGAPKDIAPPLFDTLDLKFVISHFASSDELGHAQNEQQARDLTQIGAAFPHVPKSLCNSSGLFRNKDWHYDQVRPGYALYGGNPLPERVNPVKPVVSLDVRVLQTRRVKKGESAGYNATHVFGDDTDCATVALGYADGFPRGGSNSAKLYWNGQPCPVRGRVSMDLIIVETGHLRDKPQAGQWMEVIGPHQSVDALARDCGTIGYNILTALGSRYRRHYKL